LAALALRRSRRRLREQWCGDRADGACRRGGEASAAEAIDIGDFKIVLGDYPLISTHFKVHGKSG
jgi:hypothetical protein